MNALMAAARRHPVKVTLALILVPFALISLTVQGLTQTPTKDARVCIHHAHVRTTEYAKNSPKGAPPLLVRRMKTWCDEWSTR